ncbi:LIC_10190 family membrane protein [Candidatus Omnitrophota bacterium]
MQMIGLLLTTMISILGAWVCLFLVFLGLGLLIRRSFGLKIGSIENLLTSFWLGWAYAIFFLQLWHFYFRMDWHAFLLLSIGGVLGLIWNSKDLWSFVKKTNPRRNYFLYSLFFLTVLWLANRALLPPFNYDSGLYHLNSVRWVTSFPIVPGLGNLHGRLAFNSSYFLYVAMLEIGFWFKKSYHLANGILLCVLFMQIFLSGSRLFRNKGKLPLYHIFNVLILFPLMKAGNISSPSPDLPILVLGIVLSANFLAFLEDLEATRKERGYNLFFIATIAFLGLTIKGTFFVFGLAIFLISCIVWFLRIKDKDRPDKRRAITWILISLAMSVIPWMIRGIILSGYIAYPFSMGSFPVEWRIPHASVVNMANWTYAWARVPRAYHWREVLGNWNWLIPWASATFKDIFRIALPLFLAFWGSFLILRYRATEIYRRDKKSVIGWFLLPPIISIVVWFMTAPALRFGSIFFWILGAGTLTLAVGCKDRPAHIKTFFIVMFLYIIVSGDFNIPKIKKSFNTLMEAKSAQEMLWQLNYYNRWVFPPASNFGFYKAPEVPLEKFVTRSGLVVYVPVREDKCWDATLPCSIFPHAGLRLRQKNNMRYGFMIDPRDEDDASVGMHEEYEVEKWLAR